MLALPYTWEAFSKITKHYCRYVENIVLIARDIQNTPEQENVLQGFCSTTRANGCSNRKKGETGHHGTY